MTNRAYFTVDEIDAAAGHVISELSDDPDSVLTLPIANGISARERADLLDHHGAVVREVRRRGWRVNTIVRNLPTGTVFAIDLVGRD
jgi:hypothetical protein